MSQSLWTDAADAALREMWAQRLTARQIADMLAQGARPGCTRCMVLGRVNRLGLHRSTAAELRLAAKKRLFAQTAQRARDAKRMARRAAAQKAPPAVAPPVAEADVFAALPPRAGVTFFDLREGIETVLSVATALRRALRLRRDDAFWSSVDLGNLGGPHDGLIDHPALKTATGRAQRLPGPQPGAGPAIVIPDSVAELILLGDGDSERVLTETTLERARRRYARPGLTIRTAMAPDGEDFNDVLRASLQ